jgi:phosphoribosylformylglycinamidine synthase
MVGVIENIENVTRSTFDSNGDSILFIGDTKEELGGSEYLATIHNLVAGQPPLCDLDAEKRAIDALLEAIESKSVGSAHDCSDGGLAVALAESCIANRDNQTGADIDLQSLGSVSVRGALFGESQARYVLSSSRPEIVEAIMQKHGVPVQRIGKVVEKHQGLRIRYHDTTLEIDIETISNAWHNAIPRMMAAPVIAAEPEPAMTVA